MENHDSRFVSSKSQPDGGTTPTQFAWNEYRLLLYSGLIGIVGGLGAQIFVWLLNLAERLLLVGIAGYQPPEPGSMNPQSSVGALGPVADSSGNNSWRVTFRNLGLYVCAGGGRTRHGCGGRSLSLQGGENSAHRAVDQNFCVCDHHWVWGCCGSRRTNRSDQRGSWFYLRGCHAFAGRGATDSSACGNGCRTRSYLSVPFGHGYFCC